MPLHGRKGMKATMPRVLRRQLITHKSARGELLCADSEEFYALAYQIKGGRLKNSTLLKYSPLFTLLK